MAWKGAMPAALLVVEGLPPTFRTQDLERICEPYGRVVFAKVMQASLEPFQEQLGLVGMETKEQAEQLVDHLHERQINSHALRVTLLPARQE
jgi:RNA recognition motif. (a.k.a. RRM, RBD, or RNP domain)